MRASRSYLICSVQRSGSWLLSHALEDTGVLGCPAEYFHRGDEPFWRGRWGAADEDAFLRAVQGKPVTGNGVWAAKMMQNYLADAVTRLRAWPQLGLAPDVTAARCWRRPSRDCATCGCAARTRCGRRSPGGGRT